MIISASRRTDIPAFYSEWLMGRIRAGYCHVPNPYNSKQVTEVSLEPGNVEALVFWSKNPAPLLPSVPELSQRGHHFYFLYTLNDYPAELEPGVPPLRARLATFRGLRDLVGPQRVIWRYDPIIVSNRTDYRFHEQAFCTLAEGLCGLTQRVIVSVADFYRKTDRRLATLQANGYTFCKTPLEQPEFVSLLRCLREAASRYGIEMQSCAEDLAVAGIPKGACIDTQLIRSLWGGPIVGEDPHQRPLCGCAVSKDIGINDTCLHGCLYCYATRSHDAARANFARHKTTSTVMVGPPLERRSAGPRQLPLL